MKKRKRLKSAIAFACVSPFGDIVAYWVRSTACELRDAAFDWKRMHKNGWRIVKVRLTAIGKPR